MGSPQRTRARTVAWQQRAFLSYRVDVRSIDPTAKDWQALSLDDKKRLLMETLDKNMLHSVERVG